MKRLILATSCGTLVAAVLLTFALLAADERALTILQAVYDVTTALQTFGFVLAFLFVFGALPAILIGVALRFFRRASPVTQVATPAILFLLTLAEIAREMGDASLALECLPAMAAGGLTMFWILASERIPQPLEAMFE